jgi:hypothetical protein
MNDNQYQFYLKDFIFLLKDGIKELHKQMCTSNNGDRVFLKGQIFALCNIFELAKSQAHVFGIALNEMGLDDFEMGKYLQDPISG